MQAEKMGATHTVHVNCDTDAAIAAVERITEGQMCDIVVDMVRSHFR